MKTAIYEGTIKYCTASAVHCQQYNEICNATQLCRVPSYLSWWKTGSLVS